MDAIYRLGVQLTPAWNAAVVDHQYQPALHVFGVDQVSLRCKENKRKERRNQVWRNAIPSRRGGRPVPAGVPPLPKTRGAI